MLRVVILWLVLMLLLVLVLGTDADRENDAPEDCTNLTSLIRKLYITIYLMFFAMLFFACPKHVFQTHLQMRAP
jgi:hypothetical protein